MKIIIKYQFYTDGDYTLENPDAFGCTGRNVKIGNLTYDFVGKKEFEDNDKWCCFDDAITFLTQLLCDGISISYTHYWIMEDLYKSIDSIIKDLRDYSNHPHGNLIYENVDGNGIGSLISVEMCD